MQDTSSTLTMPFEDIPCIEKHLPDKPIAQALDAPNPPPEELERLALITSVKWKTPIRLKVAFIDKPEPPADLRARIVSHMNAWNGFCDAKFTESTNKPEVRITLKGQGYWSYLGTYILDRSLAGKPTMGLQNFTMQTPEQTFRRVVRHETGHTLGFPHEHLRAEVVKWIDENKAIEYFGNDPNWWSEATTRSNVLTPLPANLITATATADLHSIMCYPLPVAILKPGAPNITGGLDISPIDKNFAASTYPFPRIGIIKGKLPIFEQAFPAPAKRVGFADIVGFGIDGVSIIRNSFRVSTIQVIKDFSYNTFWYNNKHPRLLADVTGNGAKDIVGFGEFGVHVAVNNGDNTFGERQQVLPSFGCDPNNGGWEVEKHLRFMVDIRGSGRADVLGFGGAGVFLSKNEGNLSFTPAELVLADFGYDQGWRLDRHLRSLGDTIGDGLPDIVAFGEEGVYVARNNGDGTFKNPTRVVTDMAAGAGGWEVNKHPRTIADLTGDGKVDLIGFGDAGVWVALNNGDGTFEAPKLVLPHFGYTAGDWRVEKHPRFVADITGDGKGDIVGFGDAGVWVALNNGDGTFQKEVLAIKEFGYTAGDWRVEKHLRLPVDMTGDGKADIVGVGDSSVWVSFNLGNGEFGPVTTLSSELASDLVWTPDKTVRIVTNVF